MGSKLSKNQNKAVLVGGLGLAAFLGVTLFLYFFYIYLGNLNQMNNNHLSILSYLNKMFINSLKTRSKIRDLVVKVMINSSNKL